MRALIIDDDILPAEYLAELLGEHCPEVTSAEVCISPVRGLKKLKSESFDVLFLDVEMPNMTGFELLDALEDKQTPQVVFMTAFNQYAVDAFKVNAVDYLLKPINTSDLLRAVERLTHLTKEKASVDSPAIHKITPLFDGNDYQFIPTKDIVRVLGDGSYSRIYMKDAKELLISQYLGQVEPTLLKRGFIRCHRSHIVNPHHVSKFSRSDGSFFVMSNGDMVPVSVSRKQHLKELFDL